MKTNKRVKRMTCIQLEDISNSYLDTLLESKKVTIDKGNAKDKHKVLTRMLRKLHSKQIVNPSIVIGSDYNIAVAI